MASDSGDEHDTRSGLPTEGAVNKARKLLFKKKVIKVS